MPLILHGSTISPIPHPTTYDILSDSDFLRCKLLTKVFRYNSDFPLTVELALNLLIYKAIYKNSKGESCRHAKAPSLLKMEQVLGDSLEFMQKIWNASAL